MDLTKLKAEIADPTYAGLGDEAIADAINAKAAQIDRTVMTGGELASCVTLAEYTVLQATQRQYFDMLVTSQDFPLSANVKAQLSGLFAQGSATRTNLAMLLKRSGTRAEELGFGRVTPSDVAIARKL